MGDGGNYGLLGLDVVLVEVLLEVEVRQGLTLRRGQELLERRIRLDVVLVLEALLLDVGRHRLGDVGARHLRALGLAKEGAEVISQLGGDLEDREAHRLGLTIGIERGRTALALASILDLAGNTLLELLELGVERGDGLAHRGECRHHRADLITNSLLRHLGISNRRNNRRNYRRRRRGSNLGLDRGLASDLLGLGRRSGDNRGRGSNRGRGLGSILLSNTLSSGLGGGGVHCTSSGGRI